MGRLRRVVARLWTTLRPSAAEADLAREMRMHFTLLEEELRSRGMSAEEATREARRVFGGADQAKERQRDARSFRWMDDLRRDVPYAIRTLTRAPAFTATAILTLALGVAATSAVFTLFDAVLLRPLPVDRPQELRVVEQSVRTGGRTAKSSTSVPHAWFLDLRHDPEVFSEVTAFASLNDAVLRVDGRESRLSPGSLFVSDNYFRFLGIRLALGRFLAGDSSSERGIVLSYTCWQREFGGRRSVAGEQVFINGAAFTVIGVTPASFFGLELGVVPDVFLPLETISSAQPASITLADRANWTVQVVGRLPRGISDAAAGERLTTLRDFAKPPGGGDAKRALRLLPIETGLSDVRARLALPLTLLLGMGSVLLLIACANVATLVGARAAARRSEIVIRAAIGAGRSRLVRQLATESLVLASLAGGLGLIAGSWATTLLVALLPQSPDPLRLQVLVDRRVLLFTATISLATALLAGVLPALRALGFDLASALRDRMRGSAGIGSRGRPLAVLQVALSVVLVVASVMLARTVHNLTRLDLGFDPERLVQVFVAPGERLYTGAALDRYYEHLFEKLRAVPGARAVTSSQMQMLERAKTTGTIHAVGFVPSSEEERWAQIFQVGPAYFETTGITVLSGRDFTQQDVTGRRRVAVINDVAAQRYFANQDPIGRTLESDADYEVVGVVRSAKYNSLREPEPAVLYVPYTTVRQRPRMTLLVRTADDNDDVIRTVSDAARSEDPLVPLNASAVRTVVERSMAQERLLAILSVIFASAALVLLSIGLYGIMTFWVTERTADIGVHLALGARVSQVRWVVIRQPLWLAALGIGCGVPAAIAAAGAMSSLMFGVGPGDPVTIATAVALVLAVTLAACLAPARRASRVDPMTALRCE